MVYETLLRGLGCWPFSRIMLLWIPSNWKKSFFKKYQLTECYHIFATNLQNIFKWFNWVHHYINMFQLCMQQNECSAGRKEPVMALCNHSSPCREVTKSCKLLQLIVVGWLYLFRTGVRNIIGYGTVPYPGLDFSKFVGSGTLPWRPPIMHILRRIAQKLLWRFLWNCSKQHKSN